MVRRRATITTVADTTLDTSAGKDYNSSIMKRKTVAVLSVLLALVSLPLAAQSDGTTTYSSGEYKVEFSHPSSWTVVENAEGIYLLSSAALESELSADYPDLSEGDLVVNLAVLPTMMFTFMGIEAETAQGQMDAMFDQMVEQAVAAADNVSQESGPAANGVTVSSVAFDSQEEVGGEMRSVSGMFLGMVNEEKGVFGFSTALGSRATLEANREDLVNTMGSFVYTGTAEELLGGN